MAKIDGEFNKANVPPLIVDAKDSVLPQTAGEQNLRKRAGSAPDVCLKTAVDSSYFLPAGTSEPIDKVPATSSLTRRNSKLSLSKWEDDISNALDSIQHSAQQIDQKAHEVIHKVIDWTHTSFHALPEWMQDNEYLQQFHRPQLNSYYLCCKSVFRIHTETGNIWTHLIGCLIFLGILLYYVILPSEYLFETIKDTSIGYGEKMSFIIFFLSAIACLALSTAYHTFECHSLASSKRWSKLDHVGIALMTAGSFVPWIYYGFYCQFAQKVIYLSVIGLLALGTMGVCLLNRFSTPECRPLRAGVFAALGLFGVVPVAHLIYTEFFAALFDSGILYVIVMAAIYLLGALIYAMRFPERYWPGRFDIWFQSHQLFHCCVVIAALIQLRGIRQLAIWRLAGVAASSASTCAAFLGDAYMSTAGAGTNSEL